MIKGKPSLTNYRASDYAWAYYIGNLYIFLPAGQYQTQPPGAQCCTASSLPDLRTGTSPGIQTFSYEDTTPICFYGSERASRTLCSTEIWDSSSNGDRESPGNYQRAGAKLSPI